MEVCGVPPEELITTATRKRLFFDFRCNPRWLTNSKGRKRRPGSRTLAQALRCTDPAFTDFISKCLMWVFNLNSIYNEWIEFSCYSESRCGIFIVNVFDRIFHVDHISIIKGWSFIRFVWNRYNTFPIDFIYCNIFLKLCVFLK